MDQAVESVLTGEPVTGVPAITLLDQVEGLVLEEVLLVMVLAFVDPLEYLAEVVG